VDGDVGSRLGVAGIVNHKHEDVYHIGLEHKGGAAGRVVATTGTLGHRLRNVVAAQNGNLKGTGGLVPWSSGGKHARRDRGHVHGRCAHGPGHDNTRNHNLGANGQVHVGGNAHCEHVTIGTGVELRLADLRHSEAGA